MREGRREGGNDGLRASSEVERAWVRSWGGGAVEFWGGGRLESWSLREENNEISNAHSTRKF